MKKLEVPCNVSSCLSAEMPSEPAGGGRLRSRQTASLQLLPGAGHAAPTRRGGIIAAVSVLLAVALGELLPAFASLGAGVLVCLGLVTLFLTLAAVLGERRWHAFFLIMSLVPLLRVIDLATPLGSALQPFWLPLTAIPVFAALVCITNLLDLAPRSIGLQAALPESMPLECTVALSGVGLGMIECWILRPAPIIGSGSLLQLLCIAALLLVCTGFLDVLLAQGFIQRAAAEVLGSRGGILFAATVFALPHIGWQSPLEIAFTFGVGLYFSVVRQLTGSVLGISLAHGVAAIMLFVVLPLRLTPQLAHQIPGIEGQMLSSRHVYDPPTQTVSLPRLRTAIPPGPAAVCGPMDRGSGEYSLRVMEMSRRRVRDTCRAARLKLGTYRWRVRTRRDSSEWRSGGRTGARPPSGETPPSSVTPVPDVMGNPDLLAILGLIVLLAAREISRASTRPGILRWRALLTVAVVPLLLIFAMIMAEKVIQVL